MSSDKKPLPVVGDVLYLPRFTIDEDGQVAACKVTVYRVSCPFFYIDHGDNEELAEEGRVTYMDFDVGDVIFRTEKEALLSCLQGLATATCGTSPE